MKRYKIREGSIADYARYALTGFIMGLLLTSAAIF